GACEPRGDRGERVAGAQRLRPHEVDAEVEVAEPEPALAAELGDGLERLPGLARAAPALRLVEAAGERVEDRVEVGRDVEPEHLEVVADVAHDRQLARVDRLRDRPCEPRAAEAAGQDDDVHRAEPVRSAASAAAVFGPTSPSTRSRSASVSTSSARFGIEATAAGTSSRSA